MVPIILLAVGAGGLAISSDSPDALCPPIDEAREVIQARVGAVTGGSFEARYGMRRNTLSGESLVVLTLRNEQEALLLEREIPVKNGECSDVALALALILERYFTDLAKNASDASAPDPLPNEVKEAVGAAALAGAVERPSLVPEAKRSKNEKESDDRRLVPTEAEVRSAPGPWSIRALAGVGKGLTPQVGLGGGFQMKRWWLLSLDTSFQLVRSEVVSEGYRISTIRHSLYASSLFGGELIADSWWGAGPSLGGQLQVAELMDEQFLGAGAQTRVFPSVGIQGTALWEVAERFWLGALGSGSVLFGGNQFVVLNPGGKETSVLDLPMLSWDASVVASFRF